MIIKVSKTIVNILRFLWILLILNNEYFIFWFSAKQCASISAYHQSHIQGKFMLIADPQMTDDHSYDRHWLLLSITKFISARYMRRNYRLLVNSLRPSDIIMLGDLMDSGRDWDDAFYASEVDRFHSIFPMTIPRYNMTGNHDIGFGNGVKKERLDRFERYFGPTSYTFEKYGYEFIALDTVSLSSDNPIVRQKALDVLHNTPISPTNKRILLSHVPLYRSSIQTCGPYRRQSRNPIIREGAGFQYQNLVTKELSDLILNTLQPMAIFSADDHDYCKIIHTYGERQAVEITVPTFSMSQGIQHPGVMTLNVIPNGKTTTSLCWLPDQVGLFLRYAYSLAFTLFALFIWNWAQIKYDSKKKDDGLSKEEMGHEQQPQSVSLKRCLISFVLHVKEVAWTSVIVYILCLLLI